MRGAYRLARVVPHLIWCVAVTTLAFPFLPHNARLAFKARWSRQLLDCLGVRLESSGVPMNGGLLVANHISWLDIFVINAQAPAAFVAKSEVRSWPVIGWVSVRADTLFVERGSRSAAVRTKEHMIEALRRDVRVGIFPEGTTGPGNAVMPFHGALFQSAIDAGVRVAPVAIRYTDREDLPSAAPAYVVGVSLWQSLRNIATASSLTAHVSFLPTIDPENQDRRHLAHHAHTAIAHALVELTPSRSAPPGAGTASETPGDLPGAPPSGGPPTDSPNPAPADCGSA